jgi:choline dehydrogenase-like flavoprotein
LLIEAGPAALTENKINIPGLKGSTVGGPYDWNFTTTVQPNANNRTLPATRGKVLGGSSALNLMVWNRASVAEYDAWEEFENPGWNWSSFSESMIKSENFTNLNASTAGWLARGTHGLLQTVINRWIPTQQNFWIPVMEKLGLTHNLNSLAGTPLGVMYQPSSINSRNWTRSYAANAYLPASGPNLQVQLQTRVARVNLDASGDRGTIATGVILQDGTIIQARQEVILSAGSIQSPGLLELSGIGKKSALDAAGIKQVVDLPGVGENLQDHIRFSTVHQLKPEYVTIDKLQRNTTYAAEQLVLWEANQLSHYDYSGSAISLQNWKHTIGNDTALLALAKEEIGSSKNVVEQKKLGLLLDDSVAKAEIIFSDGYTGVKGYPPVGSPLYGQGFISLISVMMHTLSRGSVHVTSANISDAPIINPNYLSRQYDLNGAVELVKYTRKIAEQEPLASAIVAEYEPGLEVVQTDDEWREYVKNTTLSIYHPAGTCAMLPKQDGGVVDPRLRVWGVPNLRVVDASIIPVLVASHTQTAVYGIAEKAAVLIIEDHRGV